MDLFFDKTTPAGEGSQVCKDARKRRAAAAADYKRFENLVYALTAAATVALIAAIVLVVVGQQTAGIVSGVGAIVTGAGAIFIKSQRDHAGVEEGKAWDEVKSLCAQDVSKLDEGAHVAVAAKA
jgi:hypothetical protein